MANNNDSVFLNVTNDYSTCMEIYWCVQYHMHRNSAVLGNIYILAPLNILLGIAAILGNGLVFAAYYHTPSLRRTSNMFIVSLAATDLLTGLMSEPLQIAMLYLHLDCNNKLCSGKHLFVYSLLFTMGATLLNLSLMSVDRYIAILHSLRYSELVTKSRATKLIVSSWATWILITIVGVVAQIEYGIIYYKYIGNLSIIVNIVFIIVLYSRITREMWRLERGIAHPAVGNVEITQAQERARERKGAKTVFLAIGLLCLCYFPLLIHGLANRAAPDKAVVFFFWFTTITMSNSVGNPILYCWRKREMRLAMLKIWRKLANVKDG